MILHRSSQEDRATDCPKKATVPAHDCFVLGDHRDHLHDSRHHGSIPLATTIGPADIFREAPAALDTDAVANEAVVLFLHACGHIGLGDAGAHLVDRDVEFAQTRGKEPGGHAQSGLGHAVLAAVDRGHVHGYGGDVDDARLNGRGVQICIGYKCLGGSLKSYHRLAA